MKENELTKDELIRELLELRKENDSLKSAPEGQTTADKNQEDSSLEKILASVMQGENAKMSWWQIEIPTGRLLFDPRKVEGMGFRPGTIKTLSDYLQMIHPDDYKPFTEALNEFIGGARDQLELEYRVRTQSGGYIWLLLSGSIVRQDDHGNPLICAGFVYKITERKLAGEQLYERDQIFQAIMENFPGFIFWKDTQSRYLGCNKAFATRVGLNSPAEIIGKTDFDLPWETVDSERVQAEDSLIKESGQPLMHIDEIQFPVNGPVTWFDKSKIPLRDPQGQVIGVIGIANDISNLKRAEQELIIANKELILQNNQRAKQAEKINKALAKAEEADRLKSEFLANMSHEIRTPMNSILGFSQLLKESDLTRNQQQGFLMIIEKSVERMLNIINDVVDFSQIESGQMTIFSSEVNINKEIEAIYDFYHLEAEAKGILIFTDTPLAFDEAILQTDRDKFHAILSNLVKNSIKFTRSGSIEIGYEKKEKYFEFFVKDTGIGITDSQKEFIFTRFRQGSESENKKYEGAGLGLSISKAYVEALGGRIWVESHPEEELNKGSVFYFTIPLHVKSKKGDGRQETGKRKREKS